MALGRDDFGLRRRLELTLRAERFFEWRSQDFRAECQAHPRPIRVAHGARRQAPELPCVVAPRGRARRGVHRHKLRGRRGGREAHDNTARTVSFAWREAIGTRRRSELRSKVESPQREFGCPSGEALQKTPRRDARLLSRNACHGGNRRGSRTDGLPTDLGMGAPVPNGPVGSEHRLRDSGAHPALLGHLEISRSRRRLSGFGNAGHFRGSLRLERR